MRERERDDFLYFFVSVNVMTAAEFNCSKTSETRDECIFSPTGLLFYSFLSSLREDKFRLTVVGARFRP